MSHEIGSGSNPGCAHHLAVDIVEATGAAVVTTDSRGAILGWSAGATRRYGLLAEGVFGRPASIIRAGFLLTSVGINY